MPGMIVGAVLAGVMGGLGGALIGFAGFAAGTWAAIGLGAAVGFAGSLLMSGAQALISGGDSEAAPRQLPFSAEATARTQMIRSPIASRKVVVGETVLSGALVFVSTHGNTAGGQPIDPGDPTPNRDLLCLVIVLAAHECDGFAELWLNDTVSTDARYAAGNNVAHAFDLGNDDGLVNAWLGTFGVGWTSAHRLRGLAHLAVDLYWNQEVFPSGIPNFKARCRGLKVYDPRTGLTVWSNNPALVVRHYLFDTDWGLGADADEIDEASFIAAANACDEIVAIADIPAEGRNVVVEPGTGRLQLQGDWLPIRTGDRVRITSVGGVVPSGTVDGTAYYAILDTAAPTQWIKLATTLANARAQAGLTFGDAGSGIVQVYRTGQPRYTCDGVIDTSDAPARILDRLMTACAGIVVYQQGAYHLHVGVAVTPTFALGVSDLRGPIQVQPRRAKRDLANAIRGTFVDPAKSWQPSDFPAVTNDLYEAEDGGEQIWRDIELPFTNDAVAAQRIAKVHLESLRQGATIRFPAKISALAVAVGDVGALTIPPLGYAGKLFRCRGWSLSEDGGVDLELEEYDDSIFDWDEGEATVIDPAPDTVLPDPFYVGPVAIVSFVESLEETRSGAGVAVRLAVTWGAAVDAFVAGYDLQYRAAGESAWVQRPRTADTTTIIDDIAAGDYEFRVRAVNTMGVTGDWSPIATYEVIGLTARPADVAGFSYTALMGQAVLRWDRHVDLDVIHGGRIRIRWSPATAGATWANAIDLFPGIGPEDPGGIAGTATEATVPLVSGTYFAKAIDSSGNPSENAVSVITTLPDLLGMNVVATIDEAAAWAGTPTDTVVVGGALQLAAATLIDDWGLIDSIVSWDAEGGIAAAGSYLFAAPVDLGLVYTCRCVADLAVIIFNIADFWDSRTDPIDDWTDVDAIPAYAVANAILEVRTTPDDPAGVSPAWSAWSPFVVGNYVARGFEFRLRLLTSDLTVNIQVTGLVVTIDMPDRQERHGDVLTSAGGNTTVTFARTFKAIPAIGHTIQAAQAGDLFELVSKSTTTAVINVRNAGARVARTVDLMAAGYGDGAP